MADAKLLKEHGLPGSMLGSPPGTTLYDLTEACFVLFGSIISTADSKKVEGSEHPGSSVICRSNLNLQGLQNSFAQWVDYTGARAPIHLSLDNKLRDHGDIREMIEMLLKMVDRNLRRLDSKDRSEAATSAIEAALQRLHLLARAIRKASITNQDQNILSFGDDDDNDIRKLAAAVVEWKFPHASPALCEHVAFTIEARRQVMCANIRRADRRAQKRPEITHRTAAPLVAPRQTPKPLSASQSARRQLPIQSIANTQPTQQSGFDANIFRAFAGSKRLALATPSIPSTPGEGSGAMTVGYPDPPEINPGDVSVPCPYCKESLSAAQIRREKGRKSTFWRRHVGEHLQPYGCLFRQCANVWFTQEADWTEHMSTVHAASWPRTVHTMTWYCDLNHESATDDIPETFSTETAWRKHMMDVKLHPEYSEQPTYSQLETLSIQKQKLAPREKGSCPFCADIPEEIRKSSAPISLDNDPRLIKHISKHIHHLSFFVFRFLDYTAVPDDEQTSDSSEVSKVQVLLRPGEVAILPEGVDDLSDVTSAPSDVDDSIPWPSDVTDHGERFYRNRFTTRQQIVTDDEQEIDSWDFLPVRDIPLTAVDEALKTWNPTMAVPFASTKFSDDQYRNNDPNHDIRSYVAGDLWNDEYHIALICATPMTYEAVTLLWDCSGENGLRYEQKPRNHNHCTTGRISGRPVVVSTGPYVDASLVQALRSSFKNLKLVLIVGLCSGVPMVPSSDPEKHNMFLGDVVISTQALLIDFGEHVADTLQIRTNILPEQGSQAVHELLKNQFKSEVRWRSFIGRSMEHLKELQQKVVSKGSVTGYERPDLSSDILFIPEDIHRHYNDCAVCASSTEKTCDTAYSSSCMDLGCGKAEITAKKGSVIARSRQNTPTERDIRVIHGNIGIADKVVKSGVYRDSLAAQYELAAFGMEGARRSVLEELPYIVVSGVCDYADSHRPKEWQSFAAATAAAATNALLQTYSMDVDGMVADSATTGQR